MAWPLSQDYNEAIQSPPTSFADPELRGGQPALNALGMPMPCSGNFADVYRFTCPRTQHTWAVKCFTRQIPGLRERYRQISTCLQQLKLPFMVGFTYLDQGIRIRGDWYPILKMEWAEGSPFNLFVRDHLDKPAVLEKLCQIWVKLAGRLRDASVAHCDLQHGNVLLVPGSKTGLLGVKLVDYDGMCVPSLTTVKSQEVGHPSYQHPERQRQGIYNLEVDRFSHLVIYTALRSLVVGGRDLWERYDNGDNLLFCQADFKAPGASNLLNELRGFGDTDVRRLANCVVYAAQQSLDRTALLTDLVPDSLPFLAQPAPKSQQGASGTPHQPAGHKPHAMASGPKSAAVGRASAKRRPGQKPAKRTLALVTLGCLGALMLLTSVVVVFGFSFFAKPQTPVVSADPIAKELANNDLGASPTDPNPNPGLQKSEKEKASKPPEKQIEDKNGKKEIKPGPQTDNKPMPETDPKTNKKNPTLQPDPLQRGNGTSSPEPAAKTDDKINTAKPSEGVKKEPPPETPEKPAPEIATKAETEKAIDDGSAVPKTLISKLTDSEWVASNGVSYYWATTGQLWCDGSLVEFDGLDDRSGTVDSKSKNTATLKFNSDFTRFEQTTGAVSKPDSRTTLTGKRLDPDDWYRIQIDVEIDGKGKLALRSNLMSWTNAEAKLAQVKLADSPWIVDKTPTLDQAAVSKILGRQIEIRDVRLLQITHNEGVLSLERDQNSLTLVFDHNGPPGPGKFTVLISVRSKKRSTAGVIQRFVGHDGPVNDIALMPDGNGFVSGGDDKTVRRWDLETGMAWMKSDHPNKVVAVGISGNGKSLKAGLAGEVRYPIQTTPNGRMVYCTTEKTICYYDSGTNKVIPGASIDLTADAWVLAFSPDCVLALVAQEGDSTARVMYTATGKAAFPILNGKIPLASAAAFSPDDKRVAFSSGQDSNALTVCGLTFVKKGAGKTAKIEVVLSPGKRKTASIQDNASINILRFSPDGRRLISGHADGSIRIWDLNTLEVTHRFQASPVSITRAVFLRDGRRLLVAANDGSIVLWALPD